MTPLSVEHEPKPQSLHPEAEMQPLVADSTCFVLDSIPDGAVIPIAVPMLGEGVAYAVNDIGYHVAGLTELIDPHEIEETANMFKNATLERPIDPNFIATLMVLNSKLWQTGIASNPDRSRIRRDEYQLKGSPGSMAAILESGSGKCAELSALCKQTLDALGIDSLYVGGTKIS